MSLKTFHLFFILVSTVLAFAVVAWAVIAHVTRGEAGALTLACVSLALGVCLVIYGARIRAKFKNMGAE